MTDAISAPEAARLLGISPQGVVAAVKRGALPGVKVLARWRIDRQAVLTAAAGAPPTRKSPADAVPLPAA